MVLTGLLAVTACGTGSTATAPVTTATSSTPAPPSSSPSAVADREELAAIADRARASCRSEGAVVGIAAPGGPPEVVAAGRFAPGVPIQADSQYFAGSVTKLLVAALALQLVDEGRLDLDDPVADFFEWERGEEITVRMLLAHRSGMGDFGNDFGDQLRDLVLADLDRVFTYEEVLALVAAVPPVAEPGARYHYSNSNSIVLGAIVQQVRDERLGEAMRTSILEPLGLDDTFYGPDDLAALAAMEFHGLFDVTGTGDEVDIGGFPRAAAFTVDPAGAGLVTTAADTLGLLDGLFAGDTVLSPRSRAFLAEHVSTLTAPDLLLDGRFDIAGHGGASPGAQVIAARDQRSGVAAVAWCNRLDPGPDELLVTVLAVNELLSLVGPPPSSD